MLGEALLTKSKPLTASLKSIWMGIHKIMLGAMGKENVMAIEEILLPQYKYLTPEPGFEGR